MLISWSSVVTWSEIRCVRVWLRERTTGSTVLCGVGLRKRKPHVILHERNGVKEEPFETLIVEVPADKLGPVMELVGERRGVLSKMDGSHSYTFVTFSIPARGLIGLRTRLLNATQGEAIMHHRFEAYRPLEGDVPRRSNGVLMSMTSGRAVAYGLNGLQQRSDLFVAPGDEVYEGMIVGENSRDNDMSVNPTKEKKLTNVRAAGSDENILLKPPRRFSLAYGSYCTSRRRSLSRQ